MVMSARASRVKIFLSRPSLTNRVSDLGGIFAAMSSRVRASDPDALPEDHVSAQQGDAPVSRDPPRSPVAREVTSNGSSERVQKLQRVIAEP